MKFVAIVLVLLSFSLALTGKTARPDKNQGRWVESVCSAYIDLAAK